MSSSNPAQQGGQQSQNQQQGQNQQQSLSQVNPALAGTRKPVPQQSGGTVIKDWASI